ncbi:hypothetical protein HK100_006920 [Physocladia obscura]|uniref:SAM domain-containing protein n=1 Tax=Physocladia obscura TaxID=109957 RepID=A0AAD5XK79_9FUNG|nr:hypothetical protein HK100_006920 [Physocladia obscura]
MLKRQYAGYIPEELVAQCNYDLDELWVYTEHEKESYISAGVDSAKIRIVPDSVDSGLFFALIDEGGLPSDKFWMFDGSEIGVGEKNFLFSGILEDVSVWHGVVDAFLEIYKESKNVKLIFQMRDLSGWINGERTFSELSAYILKTHEKNGAPGILIIDRELTAGQHRDLYRYSHCVVLPSWSSQLPWFLTIPQIMSLQLPIIDTSNVISESFISEANAFIIPSNNKNLRESLPYSEVSLKLLGKYMNICIDNTKLAEEKSLMARNKVISLFNAENIAMDIRHIFDSIAGNFSQKSAAVLQEFNPSPITYPVIHDSASCSPSTTHSIQRFNQTDPINILVITSYPPTRCGIAEFSKSLMNYLSATSKANNVFFHVMAMVPDSYTAANNPQRLVDNQNSNVQIAGVIRSQNYADYIKAASYINENIDIVSLQHEFGLFGGTDGTYILCMIKSTNKPVITTFHTVHNFLDMKHHYILRQIYMNSAANIVMGHISDIFMQSVHAVGEPKKLKLIPHGATPYKSLDNLLLKEKQGWKNNFVILSMGLHKPKKGFDIMISAMPAVLKKVPNAIFVIVGHGHPTCKDCPEYTNQMRVKAASYNLLDSKILFLEKYFDKAELDELVQTCDLYVSLYTANEITSSGTVSSAISAGRAVLATPYIYAREALSHGRGIIIPFGSVEQTAQAVIKVALDPMYRVQLQKKAFQYAQETITKFKLRLGFKLILYFIASGALLYSFGFFPELKSTGLLRTNDDFDHHNWRTKDLRRAQRFLETESQDNADKIDWEFTEAHAEKSNAEILTFLRYGSLERVTLPLVDSDPRITRFVESPLFTGIRIAFINGHHATQNDFMYVAHQLGFRYAEFNPRAFWDYGLSGHKSDSVNQNGMLADFFCRAFDIIVIGDTIPDSRFLLQFIDKTSPSETCGISKIVMMTTNRFDYGIQQSDLSTYYDLLRRVSSRSEKPQIVWTANNPFDIKYTLQLLGKNSTNFSLIRSIGYSALPVIQQFPVELTHRPAMLNHFSNSRFVAYLKRNDIDLAVFKRSYGGPTCLSQFRAFIDFPYQASTMKGSITGDDRIPKEWPDYVEYWHRNLTNYFYIFDSIEELKQILASENLDSKNIRTHGTRIWKEWIEKIVGVGSTPSSRDGREITVPASEVGRVETLVVVRTDSLRSRLRGAVLFGEFVGVCETRWEAPSAAFGASTAATTITSTPAPTPVRNNSASTTASNALSSPVSASLAPTIYTSSPTTYSRLFHRMIIDIYNGESLDALAPGEDNIITFPLSFPLPEKTLPPSYEAPSGAIKYTLKVVLTCKEGLSLFKSTYETLITVNVVLSDQERLRMVQESAKMINIVASATKYYPKLHSAPSSAFFKYPPPGSDTPGSLRLVPGVSPSNSDHADERHTPSSGLEQQAPSMTSDQRNQLLELMKLQKAQANISNVLADMHGISSNNTVAGILPQLLSTSGDGGGIATSRSAATSTKHSFSSTHPHNNNEEVDSAVKLTARPVTPVSRNDILSMSPLKNDDPNDSSTSSNGSSLYRSDANDLAAIISGYTTPLETWTVSTVAEWVKQFGTSPASIAAFIEQEIDGTALLTLTGDDLKNELKVTTLGTRRRIAVGIEKLIREMRR